MTLIVTGSCPGSGVKPDRAAPDRERPRQACTAGQPRPRVSPPPLPAGPGAARQPLNCRRRCQLAQRCPSRGVALQARQRSSASRATARTQQLRGRAPEPPRPQRTLPRSRSWVSQDLKPPSYHSVSAHVLGTVKTRILQLDMDIVSIAARHGRGCMRCKLAECGRWAVSKGPALLLPAKNQHACTADCNVPIAVEPARGTCCCRSRRFTAFSYQQPDWKTLPALQQGTKHTTEVLVSSDPRG